MKKITLVLLICIFISTITFSCKSNYKNISEEDLLKIGISEKQAFVNEVLFNYAEGPDNGIPLIMLHAQTLDWYTYNKVLPTLSKEFHVFAIDYPGHGKTVVSSDYEMRANRIGQDLASFIEDIVGEAVFLTGNSSGGLLCVWLASNRGDLVRGVVLEDPPLFSSEYNELSKTVADKLFASSYKAIQEGNTDDYLNYWIDHSEQFFKTYTGFYSSQKIIKRMVNNYIKKNPGKPVQLKILPSSVQEMVRGMNYYNPRFGAAFHDGSWNEGFSHADALQKINCPVVLIQANYSYLEDGTLNGAMSKEMAERAVTLIKNCEYARLNSGHVTNLEVPDEFATIIKEFCLR